MRQKYDIFQTVIKLLGDFFTKKASKRFPFFSPYIFCIYTIKQLNVFLDKKRGETTFFQ